MKKTLLFKSLMVFTSLAMVSLLNGQTPKSVCQVSLAPVDRDHVATPGSVSSISGDEFYLNDGGCSIKCDLNDGVPVPIMGQIIVVYGYVEVDDDDPVAKATEDETEIDVYSWTSNGGEKPSPPVATVTTVEDALVAADGTYAELTGSVTSWTEESDGEGVFADGTGSINIDFDGSKPSLSQNVVVLGRVTTDDGLKEVDVVSWYEKDGGTAPEIPVDVAFTISEAKTMPIGTLAYLDGVLTSWIVENDEGILSKDSETIEIDFDGDDIKPAINDQITVLGIIDDDLGTREIEIYAWDLGAVSARGKSLNLTKVKVYPNPANDYLIVSSEAEFSSVRLIATDGRIVLEQSAYNNQSIALDGISSGNYILILSNTESIVGIEKVLVE